MIIEFIYSKWMWAFLGIIMALVAYRLFFAKDKAAELLEKEYVEIINSDKYKVKGELK